MNGRKNKAPRVRHLGSKTAGQASAQSLYTNHRIPSSFAALGFPQELTPEFSKLPEVAQHKGCGARTSIQAFGSQSRLFLLGTLIVACRTVNIDIMNIQSFKNII